MDRFGVAGRRVAHAGPQAARRNAAGLSSVLLVWVPVPGKVPGEPRPAIKG